MYGPMQPSGIKVLIVTAQPELGSPSEHTLAQFGFQTVCINVRADSDVLTQLKGDCVPVFLIDQTVDQQDCEWFLSNRIAHIQDGDLKALVQLATADTVLEQQMLAKGAAHVFFPDTQASVIQSVTCFFAQEHASILRLKADIEQRSSAIGHIRSGEFQIRTRTEAQKLATMLSMTFTNPTPIALGLLELLVNAVEHGCLEIGHDEKGQLIETGILNTEINSRLKDKKYADRFVSLRFERGEKQSQFTITDPGPGFDFQSYSVDGHDLCKKHGRGIMMAYGCFCNVTYSGRGNVVLAVYDNEPK